MKQLILSFSFFLLAVCGKAQVSTCTYPGMMIASGTAGPVGDDAISSTTLPFTFTFYGTGYTDVNISTNGFIWLGTGPGTTDPGCCNGFLIPSDAGITDPYISLTQTDWLPNSPVNGIIFYDVVGTSPNRVFVVHYENVKHIASADRMTGEIQLYETTNEIRLVMSDLTGFEATYTGTMGIAAGDGINGVAVGTRNQSASYSSSNECFSLSAVILPITLLSFDAQKSGHAAQVSWATGVEENNRFFVVERSTNGTDFQRVATVDSKGNTSFGYQYSITDQHPRSGKNMYRLVQYDLDAKATHYGTRTVDFGQLKTLDVEPNPFTDKLNIKVPGGNSGSIEVIVTDMYGRKIVHTYEESSENEKKIVLSSADWAPGFYSVKVTRDGQMDQYKVTKL